MKGGNAGFGTVDVHEVTAAWDESTVTWNSLGSSFSAVPTQSFDESSFSAGITTFDALPIVQEWVDGPNDGLLLSLDPAAEITDAVADKMLVSKTTKVAKIEKAERALPPSGN